MEEEGGMIEARSRRYAGNNRLLIEKLAELGIHPYIEGNIRAHHHHFYPEDSSFSFEEMYRYIKERGYAIYPGR